VNHFDATTSLERSDDHRFEGKLDRTWWVVRGPHGGYLSSILLRALMDELGDPERHIRSLTVHFVAAPEDGPFIIETATERAGRSITFMSARMSQAGRCVAIALAAFSAAWSGPKFQDAVMPEVKEPDDAFRFPLNDPSVPPFLHNFDMRWAVGGAPFSGADRAELGGWMRLTEPRSADAILMATYADAWPPVVFPRLTEPVVCPTIDLTIHFRSALPAPGASPDDFYLGMFSSDLGRDGFFEETGQIWSAEGELLVQSRQLALMVPVR
jgi:acyl-CoA thioesterase